MKTSELGDQFIISFEKVRLFAYDDGCGIPTIGIGHTAGVNYGDSCTKEQAYSWFFQELEREYEPAVNAVCRQVPIMQHQFDALVSFTYNCGVGAFNTSTLRKKLVAKDYVGAGAQFLAWDKGVVNGKLIALPGLTARRRSERKMFESGIYEMHDGQTIMTGVIPVGAEAPGS